MDVLLPVTWEPGDTCLGQRKEEMITLYPEDGVIVLFPMAGVMTVLFPMAGVLVRAAGMMALYLKAGMMTMR